MSLFYRVHLNFLSFKFVLEFKAIFDLNFDKISPKFVNFLQIYAKTAQILRKLTLKNLKPKSVISQRGGDEFKRVFK